MSNPSNNLNGKATRFHHFFISAFCLSYHFIFSKQSTIMSPSVGKATGNHLTKTRVHAAKENKTNASSV